jgi:uncharacterized protein
LVILNSTTEMTSRAEPRVWVIAAYRAGEQSQLLALAEALGWPFELKTVRHRWQGALFNLFRGSGLQGIDRAQSAPLEAPWPDIVIAAGMRNEPVCRWIRRASGGKTRIVHIGRPWAEPRNFDLVVTTPQYRIAQNAKVLQNTLTLHRVTSARLAVARSEHEQRLAVLPQPRIAVIVGGPSGPYAFGARAGARLARQASAMAARLGGSLMVTTSSRTPESALRALQAHMTVPHEFYRWRADDAANPYFAYLAMADCLIVSFDSISMLSEACATGKPVYMFDLAFDRSPAVPRRDADTDLRTCAYRMLMRWGPRRLARDITLVHQQLLRDGRARWLGAEESLVPSADALPDIDRAVARVRALLDQPAGESCSSAEPPSSR